MPDPIEPQLDELRRRARRRLIGAIVLALAAAVLVPMLLESDPKPLGEDVSVRIPPVDDSKFVSKLGDKAKAPAEQPAVAKATEPPKAEPAAPVAAAPAQATSSKDGGAPPPAPSRALAQAEQRVISPQSKPASGTDSADASTSTASKAPTPAAVGATAPTAEPPKSDDATKATKAAESAKAAAAPKAVDAPKAAEPAAAGAGAYSVQLAAFTDDKGANALAAKLKKAGHPSYIEPYETSRGRVWRVRVGPYPSREAAESARTKLKAEGQNGILAAAK
jgi:DedD protein